MVRYYRARKGNVFNLFVRPHGGTDTPEQDRGIPPPPPPPGPGRFCGEDGFPLAFKQEDFLVLIIKFDLTFSLTIFLHLVIFVSKLKQVHVGSTVKLL